MKMRKILFAAAVLAAVAVILQVPISASAQDASANAGDPPGRVARLDFVQGSVSFQPAGGGDNDWVAAEVNRPLTTGDQLWADTDGQVEMEVDSTTVRMDHNTGVSYLNLSDSLIQLQVSAGSVIVHLPQLDPNNSFEVDAPNLAFSLLQPGTYQIDVDPDKDVTVVTVVNGEGQVTGGGRSWNITADQQATFTGTDTLDYTLADADSLPQSAFQQWSAQRDAAENQAAPDQYVSPEMTGSEDLDTYGSWTPEADYGAVWFPTGVAVGWAPYRFGHWVWIAPWGWTWVESEPWGFAPFHYGRWAAFGGRWGWVPGPVVVGVRPVYAPALVAWVGGTPGFSFSVAIGGGGGIGWFALGPREVFMPTYRVSETYMTRVNVTNTVVDRNAVIDVYHNNARNITYANEHVQGGVTVVSHNTFVSGGNVSRNVVNVPDRDLASAPVNRAGPAAEPTRASTIGGAQVATHRPPANVASRPTVAVHTPPAQPQAFRGNGAANSDRGGSNYRPPAQPGNSPASRTMNGSSGNEGAPPANTENRGSEPGNERGNQEANPAPAPQPEQQSHPNVRQAPPVRQPTQQEQQNDNAKQQAWQNKHQQVHQNDKSSGASKSQKPPHS
ncbi:MAG: DUF6600 domain-containing protein [Candidatus Acidiferrales bacterium]